MNAFETELRALIRAIVLDEIKRALAEVEHDDEFLSVQAAAKLADVAEGTLRRWIREERIEGFRAGSRLRVKRSDLERFLAKTTNDNEGDDEPSPEELARRAFD